MIFHTGPFVPTLGPFAGSPCFRNMAQVYKGQNSQNIIFSAQFFREINALCVWFWGQYPWHEWSTDILEVSDVLRSTTAAGT